MKNLSKTIRYYKYIITLGFCLTVLIRCSGIQAKPGAVLGEVPSKGPVGKTFQKNASKFEACAQDSVSVQTGSIQNLQLLFYVDKDGNVLKPSIEKMSEPDPDLFVCILKALKRIKFPKPDDQKTKKVDYPLQLKPAA